MIDKEYEYLDKIQVIETERLFLKKANDDDFKILAELLMDTEVTKYLEKRELGSFKNTEEAFDFLKNSKTKFFPFSIILKSSGACVGGVNLQIMNRDNKEVEKIGIFLGKKYWNQGIAKEASFHFLDEVFLSRPNISILEWELNINNLASLALFKDLAIYAKKMNENLRFECLQDKSNIECISFFFLKTDTKVILS